MFVYLKKIYDMAQTTVRFTLKGQYEENIFTIVKDEDDHHVLYGKDENGVEIKIQLNEGADGVFFLNGNNPFEESQDIVDNRLLGLSEEWMDYKSQGFESEGDDGLSGKPGYSVDDIFVENKPFSLKQIVDLINGGDIELNPNFQRHFIWDNTRQSRLIESIFLGLPLPSIYLSQYDDGRLTIVDGLQRLSTIKRFMDNQLRLANLEYLVECNGCNYSQLGEVLSPLRIRRFGQTQIMCFVIDYRSPSRLKYDLFKRLNTGGKPLNNQEIRNCLSRPHLQQALSEMTKSKAFCNATSNSIKSTRMEDQESALRFMYFYDVFTYENPIGTYNGNIEITLNDYIDVLNRKKDFTTYVDAFEKGLKYSYALFGEYSFRKIYGRDFKNRRKNQINKLLMMAITILLIKYEDIYQRRIMEGVDLTYYLAELIENNQQFFNAITWSTNSRGNIEFVFNTLKTKLFDKYLV